MTRKQLFLLRQRVRRDHPDRDRVRDTVRDGYAEIARSGAWSGVRSIAARVAAAEGVAAVAHLMIQPRRRSPNIAVAAR